MKSLLNLLTAVATILAAQWYLKPDAPQIIVIRQASIGGDTAPDGTPVQVDLPRSLRLHNTGGIDGLGLCVPTSINHAAIWQDVEILKDLQKWWKQYPGGGYPQKVDQYIAAKCRKAAVPVPRYVQYEGNDLDLIKTALKTGRMACTTYAWSPSGRYSGQHIDHMVNTVHATGGFFAVLDNNYPEALEWLTEKEYAPVFSTGGGWCIILLDPGPPPAPKGRLR